MNRGFTLGVAAILFAIVVTALAQEHRNAAAPAKPWRSRNYEVHGNLSAADARPIVAHMDAVYEEYERRFAGFVARDSSMSRLYLFDTSATYLAELAKLGVDAKNSGGVCFRTSRESGLATFVEDQTGLRMFHVLQHEGFHQFARTRIGDSLPPWANEGTAEYFGQAILVKGKLRTGVAPESRIALVRNEIKDGLAFPLEELLTISHERWNMALGSGDPRAGVLYDQSWSVVHFLIHAEGGKYAAAMQTYIDTTSTGASAQQAMIKAFGSADAAGAMDRKWRDWALKEWTADPLSTAAERVEFLGKGIAELAKRKIAFGSLDELKALLRKHNFEDSRTDHGIKRTLSADDERLFEAPPPADNRPGRRPVTMELTPPGKSKSGPQLPEVRVTGLSAVVRLKWLGTDADPRPEVVFE